MLTFLTVEKAEAKRLLPLKNKILVENKSAEGVDVKHIKYIHRRGKISWDKIRKTSGTEAERLLAKEALDIPEGIGLRRFYCLELKARLCLNMAVEVLKGLKKSAEKIKVAVYDPDGGIADGVGAMLKYTQSLTVVTRMTGLYNAEAQRLMEESGAVLSVSRRMKSLSDAKLILAPQRLDTVLPVEKQAVLLTTAPPAVSQRCGVYYKYYFNLSEELVKLMPQGFDAEYFASALYTLCGRHDFGSVVPQATKGEGTAHTLVSLSKYLMNIAPNT